MVVISEQGPATVRLRDPSGDQVLEIRSVPAGEAGEASGRLDAGRYVVQCRRDGDRASTTTLEVEPARPGIDAPPVLAV